MGYACRCQQARARALCGQNVPGIRYAMLAPERAGGRPRRERRLQGNLTECTSKLLIPGASGGKVIKTQKTLLGGGGRAIPTRLPSASSGGPTAQLSETPPGARAKIAKTPFLFERNAVLVDSCSLAVFWEIQPKKKAQ